MNIITYNCVGSLGSASWEDLVPADGAVLPDHLEELPCITVETNTSLIDHSVRELSDDGWLDISIPGPLTKEAVAIEIEDFLGLDAGSINIVNTGVCMSVDF